MYSSQFIVFSPVARFDGSQKGDPGVPEVTGEAVDVAAVAVRAAVISIATTCGVRKWAADPLMVGHEAAGSIIRAVTLVVWANDTGNFCSNLRHDSEITFNCCDDGFLFLLT